MIIAVSTDKNNVNSAVDFHFGRCTYFYMFDTNTRKSSFIENPGKNHEKAGCIAAEFLIKNSANVTVAGHFGSNVIDLFRRANIQMVIPETNKTITDIINLIKKE